TVVSVVDGRLVVSVAGVLGLRPAARQECPERRGQRHAPGPEVGVGEDQGAHGPPITSVLLPGRRGAGRDGPRSSALTLEAPRRATPRAATITIAPSVPPASAATPAATVATRSAAPNIWSSRSAWRTRGAMAAPTRLPTPAAPSTRP